MPKHLDDILQIIPDREIDRVYEILMREWPVSAYHCGVLKTCYDWRKKNPAFDVEFYYCKNNFESGIFIAILNSGHTTFGVIPYAIEGQESELKKVLSETKKIDWNKLPLLQGVLPRQYELMEEVVKTKGLNTLTYCEATTQLLDIDLVIDYDLSYPDDVYVRKLTTEDNIDLIYDLWANKVIHTKEYIVNIISLSLSYGIFSKSNDELLAWVMLSHYGAIGTLYTREIARNRRYAKILVKTLSKKMAQKMNPPYATIREKNIASNSLFLSLGFKKITRLRYVRVV